MSMDEIRERVLERFRHDGKGRRYVTREELDAQSAEVYGRWAHKAATEKDDWFLRDVKRAAEQAERWKRGWPRSSRTAGSIPGSRPCRMELAAETENAHPVR